MMRSALRTVERRCAITIEVRAFSTTSSPSLDLLLGEGIDAGGRLVEDADRGVLEQQTGEGHELTLAERQAGAALAHICGEALGQVVDPLAAAEMRRAVASTSSSGASGRP